MIVLDSSFIIALHNQDDAHHADAQCVASEIVSGTWGKALLLEYVFLEVVTVLSMRRDLQTALLVGQQLLAARELEFVPCSGHFASAYAAFREQPVRSSLSFVDAALVAVAKARQVTHIATFDQGFRQVPRLTTVPD